ncbi:MAG: hypothetical protein ACR2MP_06110, partial [Streptosporangiaceae bacterium]
GPGARGPGGGCWRSPGAPAAAGTVGHVMETLAVENYRSLRRLVVPLAALNLVTGANGAGKSSL